MQRLKGHGLTILIIDHDMNLVAQVADKITVLNFGKCIAHGLPQDVCARAMSPGLSRGDDCRRRSLYEGKSLGKTTSSKLNTAVFDTTISLIFNVLRTT